MQSCTVLRGIAACGVLSICVVLEAAQQQHLQRIEPMPCACDVFKLLV